MTTEPKWANGPGANRLSRYFGLSYASWLTIPRAFLDAMPDWWQGAFAGLLEQYEEAYNAAQIDIPVTVKVVGTNEKGRFVSISKWCQYRRPGRELFDVQSRLNVAAQSLDPSGLSAAARDVLAERQRQIEVEGWTPEHDHTWDQGELAMAAASYAVSDKVGCIGRDPFLLAFWPWRKKWWKPKDRRRDLVRAGALILAEIERLDRAAAREGGAS